LLTVVTLILTWLR